MGTRAGAFPLATTSANRFVVRARLGEVRAAVEDGRQTLAALDRTNERNYFGGVLCHCATALAELDELGPAAELFGASASISPVVTNPFYGWAHVQPKLEESLGRARYDECVARGHALDKDDALAVFRTALDAIEARLGNHD